MGETLAELHGARARLEVDALGVPSPTWPHRHDRLQKGIDAHLEGRSREAARAIAEHWSALDVARDRLEDVLVHGDFGSHNFAFDERASMPNGVFDFHDMGRAPRWVDLKVLPSYGADATATATARRAASRCPRKRSTSPTPSRHWATSRGARRSSLPADAARPLSRYGKCLVRVIHECHVPLRWSRLPVPPWPLVRDSGSTALGVLFGLGIVTIGVLYDPEAPRHDRYTMKTDFISKA